MLVFRKWFLALALVTLTVAVAGAGVQQDSPAFTCISIAGVPPMVRAEGIAELTGDIVLNCTGGYPARFVHGPPAPGDTPSNKTGMLGPAEVPQVNVQVFLNTNITSKIDTSTSTLGGAGSEALLMIDEPAPAEQVMCTGSSGCGSTTAIPQSPSLVYKNGAYNIWQGRQSIVSNANSLHWQGVPVDAPGTTATRTIRITNIRANASQLGVTSSLVPLQIVAYISIGGNTSIAINNPQQTVAWIQQGLTFSVRKLNGDSGSVSLMQCASNAKDLTDPPRTDKYCFTGRLRYEEGFATSFKTRFRNGPGANSDGRDNQNTPNAVFNSSESGFWTNGVDGAWQGRLTNWAGRADQGTRFRATFNNVPAGVRLYVSTRNSMVGGMGNASLISTAEDGSGGYVTVPSSSTTNKASDGACSAWKEMRVQGTDELGADIPWSAPIAEIPVFNNKATAVWEVTNTNPLAVQRMEFGYLVAYKSDTANSSPGLGSVTVNGSFAPISTITKMSAYAPVPRFADTSEAKTAYKIEQCVTNLLFPFVTNQAGFDTGMVIANTSKDPFETSLETGTCKLNYYGDTNGGAAPPAQTSAAIPAGDYLIWGLSSGGKFGMTATQGFQGYIIAQCNFRWAHGFAFISDYGNTKTAQGYLALVLANSHVCSGSGVDAACSSLNRTDPVSEALGQ